MYCAVCLLPWGKLHCTACVRELMASSTCIATQTCAVGGQTPVMGAKPQAKNLSLMQIKSQTGASSCSLTKTPIFFCLTDSLHAACINYMHAREDMFSVVIKQQSG